MKNDSIPAASSQQPAASSQQPAASSQQPAATAAELFINNFEEEREHLIKRMHAHFPHTASADIRDAISDAIAALYEEHRQFEMLPELRAWLISVATNRLLDGMKHAAHSVRIDEIEEEPSGGDETLANGAERFDAHTLMLACLDPHERSVVMCRCWLELSFEELAARRVDGLSAETLRQRFHRAMNKLIAYTEKYEKAAWK